jgi:adenosylhomocysteine nucleosidase
MPHRFVVLVCAIAVTWAVASLAAAQTTAPASRPTAILGAMRVEVELIAGQLADRRTRTHLGVKFHSGTLGGRAVVVAHTGIGKVNAGAVTALLLDRFAPAEVIFTGVAGGIGPDLLPGDILIGRKTVQHDFGEVGEGGMKVEPPGEPAGGRRAPMMIEADGRLLATALAAAEGLKLDAIATSEGKRTPAVRQGIIATGDVFVASAAKCAQLRKTLGADAVEMEGAAVAQVCWSQSIPCLVVRSISDKADAAAHVDFRQFVRAAAVNSAKLTSAIVARLAQAPTTLPAGGTP